MRKHQLRGEDGQTLILVALGLPLLLAMIALVIDGANLFTQRRSVQNAADAAVLAAGAKLNSDASPCTGPDTDSTTCAYKVRIAAEEYSNRNGGPSPLHFCADSADTNCYLTPYNGDNTRLQVRLKKSVSGFFTGAVGLSGLLSVSARAVAGFSAPTAAGNVGPLGIDKSKWSPALIDVPNQKLDFDASGFALFDLSHISPTAPIVAGTNCNRTPTAMNDDIRFGYPGDGSTVVLPANAWYCDNNGVKNGIKSGLHDAYTANKVLLFPVFDTVAPGSPTSYHVIGFAAFVMEQDPQSTWNSGGGGNHFLWGHFTTFVGTGVAGGSGGAYFGVLVLNLAE
jgi:Flp pilus assembly protein TadG